MATEIRRRRGSTADHSTFTGAPAELTVDTDKNTIVVHDGATAGGWPVPTNIETLRDVTFTSAAEEDGLVRISGVWVNTSSVTSGLRVPSGTEAQRSVTGGFTIRFNTDAGAYEGYNGTSWVGLGAASADLVPYDNTASGLTANDVQAAIDEVEERVDTVEGRVDTVEAEKLDANDALGGSGQSWQDVSSSRARNVIYTNSTGRPIEVALSVAYTNAEATFFVDDVPLWAFSTGGTAQRDGFSTIVPDGSEYRLTASSGGSNIDITAWGELR